ncbi:MAG: alpha/beta hydrolase domain-containing protein [Gemmatimonadota bacterium]
MDRRLIRVRPRRARNAVLCLGLLAALLAVVTPASAELVRIEVLSRTPFLGGRSFGVAGPYEVIVGRAHFVVDPDLPANRGIVDLALARRDPDGRVRFSSDVQILRPVDPTRGNGTLLVEIVNRGGRNGVRNRATAGEQGLDRFVAEQGFTLAWVGWEVAVRDGGLRMVAPVARRENAPILGPVSHGISQATAWDTLPAPYWAVDLDGPGHRLEVREEIDGPFVEIPRDQWGFGRMEEGVPVPDSTLVYLKGGFRSGPLYRLVFTSTDPPLVGLGFAAIRDFASHVRSGRDPLVSAQRAVAFGWSQSGRFLRDFVYEGFNANENGGKVFDGVIPLIAGAGGGGFNHRFALPTVGAAYGRVPTPNDHFPFTDLPQRDPWTGREEGLLDRARRDGVVPRIFNVNTSSEYDDRGSALIHVTPDGSRDVPVPETSRIYTILGAPHVGRGEPEATPELVARRSPVGSGPLARGLLVAMHRWIAEGVAPPESRYPRISEGELVPYDPADWPPIPGVERPVDVYRVPALDYGPEADRGILRQPPEILGAYPALLPAVDADGNELGGVRMPEVAVPLATYAGWNLEAGWDEPRLANRQGSYFPFPWDAQSREATGDPRASILERYGDRDGYLRRYAEATRELIADGFLLETEFDALMGIAEDRWTFHEGRPTVLPHTESGGRGGGR